MRFDNAFLTKDKNVGMQFIEKDEVFTVYKDKKGVIHISEHATDEQKAIILNQYKLREHRYLKG
ncbi:MAG TPA: hypothetical protein VFM18_21800 [Methanosarcina sp.]|nr:hypothetical protein [Methanosarcina sp.]